jgi:hypothetical protein
MIIGNKCNGKNMEGGGNKDKSISLTCFIATDPIPD